MIACTSFRYFAGAIKKAKSGIPIPWPVAVCRRKKFRINFLIPEAEMKSMMNWVFVFAAAD